MHPRTAATYSRFFRQYVRETSWMSMLQSVKRCTLGPARVVQDCVPAMRRRGRVQTGCGAALVVFDPATITDHATYLAGIRPPTGYRQCWWAARLSPSMTTSFSIACPAAP